MAEYSGQSTNFLSKTFEVLDDALSSFAQNFSSNIAAEIAPLVMGGITLSFILLGIFFSNEASALIYVVWLPGQTRWLPRLWEILFFSSLPKNEKKATWG